MKFKMISVMVLVCSVLLLAVEPVDYSLDSNWAVKTSDISHKVDVFFVHPTTYGSPSNGQLNADLNDQKLNKRTDGTIQRQASAFNDTANLFAPRYRQMNIEVLSMSEEKKNYYIEMPVADVKAAFEYYLENLNGGRPFILASHSQGSNVLQLVLLENPKLIDYDKIVAAYLIGWTFTDKQIKEIGLELCDSPSQTGCLITWNTIAADGKSPTLLEGARCVNPLSWTNDTKQYPASMNECSRVLTNSGKYESYTNLTSARINSCGGLEIAELDSQIKAKLSMNMGPTCYHPYDYDFFYCNIAKNAALRCKEYLGGGSVSED